ncbi:hypothetical protein Tco_0936643 [Tanacetum coccineum]|uniref:Uncharacterized protein n=1 Tax=Tanacetum coccineum TaxID=301880 RepID=A0ABQ5DEQ7_9ASTR
MKMEILLEPTSNKLMVGDLCDSIRIKLVTTGKKRWCDSIRIKLVPGTPDDCIKVKEFQRSFRHSDTERLSRSDEVLKLNNFKKDASLKLFKSTNQERSHSRQDKEQAQDLKSMITTSNHKLMIEVKDYEHKTKVEAIMETEAIDNHANLVNYDNEIDDLGYQSEEYIEDAHEDDENNHSNGYDKRGITRLCKFRREYGKPGGVKLSVTFDALNRISGKHRALFSSFLGDIVHEQKIE